MGVRNFFFFFEEFIKSQIFLLINQTLSGHPDPLYAFSAVHIPTVGNH